MKERVLYTIKQNALLNAGDNVVIGVSGGPDSMVLLDILYDLSREIGYKIYAAHINHGIRGNEADKDQEYVKNFCGELSIPFYSKKVNMDEYARKMKLTSEEAGREIRYSFFNEIVEKIPNGKIAVAHNKNDQAETLLLRILRGTGVDGLKGMEYKNGNIIRPLLDIERSDIEKYCEEKGLKPRIDRTNLEPIYGRNKIRLELIPYIQENFNKGIIDTLARTSKLMQMDGEFLSSYCKNKYKNIVVEEELSGIVLDIEKLLEEHQSILTRVVRMSIEKVNNSLKGIEEKHINSIISLIKEKQTGKYINISNNIVAMVSYNNLIIKKDNNDKFIGFNYEIKVGEQTKIHELNAKLYSSVYQVGSLNIDYKNRYLKYFDYDKIKSNLFIRTRRNGDKFIPYGMKGSKKLKDYLIDEKIPRDQREKIPIVDHDGEIIWVVGYRISDKYKITSSTKRVLVLEYVTD